MRESAMQLDRKKYLFLGLVLVVSVITYRWLYSRFLDRNTLPSISRHDFSPVPSALTDAFILFLDVPLIGGMLSFLIVLLVVSGSIYGLYRLKNRRIVIVSIVLLFVVLFGFDEPAVNATINRPDTRCEIDSDCVRTRTQMGGACGVFQCVNEDWTYYDSAIRSVSGLIFCPRPQNPHCACVESRCISTYIPSRYCDGIRLRTSYTAPAPYTFAMRDGNVTSGVRIEDRGGSGMIISLHIEYIGVHSMMEERYKNSREDYRTHFAIEHSYDPDILGELESIRVTPYFVDPRYEELIVCEDQAISLYPE